jgi:hypothetical protein
MAAGQVVSLMGRVVALMRDVRLGKFGGMFGDMSGLSLWLAGEAGQLSLARSAGRPGTRAAVEQHAVNGQVAVSPLD